MEFGDPNEYSSDRDSHLKAIADALGTAEWKVEIREPASAYKLACEASDRAKDNLYRTVYEKYLYDVKSDIVYGLARDDGLKAKFVAAVPTRTIVFGVDDGSFVPEGCMGLKGRIVDGKVELLARAKRFNPFDYVYDKIMTDVAEEAGEASDEAAAASSSAASSAPSAAPASSGEWGDPSEYKGDLERHLQAIAAALKTAPWKVEIREPAAAYKLACEASDRAKGNLYRTVYEKYMFDVQADICYGVARDDDVVDSFVEFVPNRTIVFAVEEGADGIEAAFREGNLEIVAKPSSFNPFDYTYNKIMRDAVKKHRGDKEKEPEVYEGANDPNAPQAPGWTRFGTKASGSSSSSGAGSGKACQFCKGSGKRLCQICKGAGSCKRGVNCSGTGYLKGKCTRCSGTGSR